MNWTRGRNSSNRAPARQPRIIFFPVVIAIAHPPDSRLEHFFFPVVIMIVHPPDRRLELFFPVIIAITHPSDRRLELFFYSFLRPSVFLPVRAKRGIEWKSVNQKEKEMYVLVFVLIDLIQIEYWNCFSYKLMWYDLYHVSNFTWNCMYRPYM
jgi:hypothetical protein